MKSTLLLSVACASCVLALGGTGCYRPIVLGAHRAVEAKRLVDDVGHLSECLAEDDGAQIGIAGFASSINRHGFGFKRTRGATAMEMLQRYPWPGNVRELRNAIEQALIVTTGNELNMQLPDPREAALLPTLKGVERRHILAALEKTGWRIKGTGGAAELLGVKPSTLYTTMRRLAIPTRREKDGGIPS